jgi:hypothetical protein
MQVVQVKTEDRPQQLDSVARSDAAFGYGEQLLPEKGVRPGA